jgi:S1-C subfamily serine protease
MMKSKTSYWKWAVGAAVVLVALYQPKSHENQIITVAAGAAPKTVMIAVDIEEPILVVKIGDIELYRSTETTVRSYRGSGVFISPTGHILTCAHLFNSGRLISMTVKTKDGYEQPGEVINVSTRYDLALAKIEVGKVPVRFARLADPKKLKVGQEVVAIGNALGLEFSVSHGIISYLSRDLFGAKNMTQSDAFINPGNSGGPLFDLDGRLVGINVFMVPPVNAPIFTGLGFSVAPDQIADFLSTFRGL